MSGHVIESKPTVGTIFNASVYSVAEKIIKETGRDSEKVIQLLLKRQPKPKIRTIDDLWDILKNLEEVEQQQAELRAQQFQIID